MPAGLQKRPKTLIPALRPVSHPLPEGGGGIDTYECVRAVEARRSSPRGRCRVADVVVYVDGFNLYYGSLKRTPYKWLDLSRLCTAMLPNDRVTAIKYYTARISARPGNPEAPNGVATTISTPRTSAFTCGRIPTPPKIAAARSFTGAP